MVLNMGRTRKRKCQRKKGIDPLKVGRVDTGVDGLVGFLVGGFLLVIRIVEDV